VRDSSGVFQVALSAAVPSIIDPGVAKAMAAWRAVNFCCDLGFQRTIFEGDSLNVVNALCMLGSCWNRFGQLIEDT
jgi:hypothetical protein